MSIFDQIDQILKVQDKTIFSSSEIKELCKLQFGSADTSVIPSDYCYNRTNHGIKDKKNILLYLGSGRYQYVGPRYSYTGFVFHKEKGSNQEKVVGEWITGVYTKFERPLTGADAKLYHLLFKIGDTYTKKDIFKICSVPEEKQGGDWNTGYHHHKNAWFIFANMGTSGRTGHDYNNNYFIGDDLHWYGRTGSKLGQASVDNLIAPSTDVLVFYRGGDREPFTYAGKAYANSFKDESPVQITWSFISATEQNLPAHIPEEVSDAEKYVEGSTKRITVNTYERNLAARKKCLDNYGYDCSVCSFNFEDVYGEQGKEFIHVHHLKQLSDIGDEYELDPIMDLRPVCPNCHAMIHRQKSALSIEDLRLLIKSKPPIEGE